MALLNYSDIYDMVLMGLWHENVTKFNGKSCFDGDICSSGYIAYIGT